jgi:hypothetical protein
MTDGYVLRPETLEHDATQAFGPWSDSLDKMEKSVPVDMASSDFSNIPGAQDVYAVFQDTAEKLQGFIKDGSAEFDGFSRALLNSVAVYMAAEGYSEADIQRISGELAAL